MRGARRVKIAAGLALALCAAGAARGESDKLERGAPAEASLEERLKAAARTIPGTGIRYLIAGYVQLDAHWTRRELTGEEKDAFLPSAIPFEAAERDARLNGRASQINAILHTPTSLGELTAHAQADLFRYEEGAQPNVTQAYVRLGEWLTVGKTYSTFMDDEAWPATLDYNGPSGAVFARQIVLRGSVPLGENLRVDAALEDPQAESGSADRPDLAARLRFAGERLHAQLGVLSRSVTYTSSAGASRSVDGWGVSASAGLGIGESDRLLAQWTTGEGIGRYFNDGLSSIGAVLDAGGTLEPLRLTGMYFYYERKWAERWSTTAGLSELRTQSEGLRPADDLKRVQYASVNLVHRLATDLFVGAELLWGNAERQDGAQASDSRLQLTARYLIY
jgi:hypothetical protein